MLDFGQYLKNKKNKMKIQKRLIHLANAIALVAILALQVLPPSSAAAATQITARSLTLVAGTTDGGSKPGGTVDHKFQFTLSDTTDTLGSITFQYCTTAAAVASGIGCVAPTGISTHTATLGAESGATGFTTITSSSIDDASDGAYNVTTIGRSSASTIGASPVAVTVQINGVVNPTAAETFFVRIATHSSLDGSGAALEAGTVAAATSTQIQLSGTMPESLVFCAGATVGVNAGSVPDCSTVTTGTVNFDRLFSPTDTAIATSQMAASTNAGSGYAITVNGPTLTSGTNTVAPMSDGSGGPTAGIHGVSQFGLNLVANTVATSTPAVGIDIAPASGTGNYKGEPVPHYATVDSFKYADGDTVADSANAGTDAQIYTTSYIVNVPGSQPAGTYSTTLTYICTPTF